MSIEASADSAIVISGEDRASKIRKIKKIVSSNRNDDDAIARAMVAPVLGVFGERAQLRYLQVAENVAVNSLFTRISDDEDDGTQSAERMSAQASSLLTSHDSDEGEGKHEGVLALLAVHSVILMVSYFLAIFAIIFL